MANTDLLFDPNIGAGVPAPRELPAPCAQPAWRFSDHGRQIAAAFTLLVVMFPFLWLVHLAFKPTADLFEESLFFTPTLDGFRSLLQGNFLKSFGNSLAVSTISTTLSM